MMMMMTLLNQENNKIRFSFEVLVKHKRYTKAYEFFEKILCHLLNATFGIKKRQ